MHRVVTGGVSFVVSVAILGSAAGVAGAQRSVQGAPRETTRSGGLSVRPRRKGDRADGAGHAFRRFQLGRVQRLDSLANTMGEREDLLALVAVERAP